MRLLVVGAGATGGYFGGRLAAAGRDVTFLVRPGRARQLAHGLEIVSPQGDVAIIPRLVAAGDIAAPFDAVLLSVKAYGLESAIADFAPAVGPGTVVIPVLNGMAHIDRLAARFGREAVVGGLCRIFATLDGDGRIIHLAPLHDVVFGEWNGSASPRLTALEAFFQGAGFAARRSGRIEAEMWEKWMMLAAFGAVTCLMRGAIGEIEAAAGGRAFAEACHDEVVAVATALGHPPSPASWQEVRTMLTAKASPATSSMYRDLIAGGRIEADQIVGDLLARGAQAGVATPLLAAAYAHLSVYQNRL